LYVHVVVFQNYIQTKNGHPTQHFSVLWIFFLNIYCRIQKIQKKTIIIVNVSVFKIRQMGEYCRNCRNFGVKFVLFVVNMEPMILINMYITKVFHQYICKHYFLHLFHLKHTNKIAFCLFMILENNKNIKIIIKMLSILV